MQWSFIKINDLTERDYQTIYKSLSPSRKNHIDRMKHSDARLRSLAAQHLLTQLLENIGVSAALETDQLGKPFLQGSDLFVSISHSFEGVVCAVSATPLGIDIEKIREVPEKLIHYVCTDSEKAFVLSDDENTRREHFFRIWTAKEALLKKTGQGLQAVLDTDTLPLSKEVYLREGYIITLM